MFSPDTDTLRARLREAGLKLYFAKSFLREVKDDGQSGLDHDAALSTAVRAVTEAEAEYASIFEQFTKKIKREQQHAEGFAAERPNAAGQD